MPTSIPRRSITTAVVPTCRTHDPPDRAGDRAGRTRSDRLPVPLGERVVGKRLALPATFGGVMDGFIESAGLRIHYVDHGGDGPPVVMLPGLSANAHFFDAVIDDGLGVAARCIALDLRGRGQTDRPASGFGLDDHAADVIGVLDALELDRVVLGGHSYGALLTYHLATTHRDRFDRYVLFDPPPPPSPDLLDVIKPSLARLALTRPSVAAYIDEVRAMPYFQGWDWDPRIESHYRADTRQNPDGTVSCRPNPDDMLQVFEATIGVDPLTEPEQLDQPFLFLRARGEFGPPGSPVICDEQHAKRAQQAHQNLTLAEFDGNHVTFMWGPTAAQVAATVTEFLHGT